MDTLFDFEEQPQEQKPPTDWQGNELPVSDNPMVRRFGKTEGKMCKDCKYLVRLYYHNKTYIKCDKRGITHGRATDHKVSFEACSKFEQEEGT
jgi:hypothetical protein